MQTAKHRDSENYKRPGNCVLTCLEILWKFKLFEKKVGFTRKVHRSDSAGKQLRRHALKHDSTYVAAASFKRTLNPAAICVDRASTTFHSFWLKEAVQQIKAAAAAVFVGGFRGVREKRANEMS